MRKLKKARKIANELKSRIKKAKFLLTEPYERLSSERVFRPMKEGSK